MSIGGPSERQLGGWSGFFPIERYFLGSECDTIDGVVGDFQHPTSVNHQ